MKFIPHEYQARAIERVISQDKVGLFLDMGLDLGFFYSKNDPYFWGADEMGWYYYDYTGDPAIFRPRLKGFTWLGPTRAYISIGVDLFTRRR